MAGNLFGNTLFYGDNLDILREQIPDESVDLVYLDPPFNSNASYNVLFKQSDGAPGAAQLHAFDDTWHWGSEAERTYHGLVHGSSVELANLAEALRSILGTSDMLAYLIMMAPRLMELRRVLKPSGTLYLHCDPTASHYLKLLLDAACGANNFRGEIIWKRTSAHSSAKRFAPVHDVILSYGAGGDTVWNPQVQPPTPEYLDEWFTNRDPDGRRFKREDLTAPGIRAGDSGRPWHGIDPTANRRHWAIPGFVGHVPGATTQEKLDALEAMGRIHWPARMGGMPRVKRYMAEAAGTPVLDVITDIRPVHNVSIERIGYPTQKPLALLGRMILASTNAGDTVLDPFCGCGTAVDAAQKLGRHWIGIDISYLAIDIIDRRMREAYGEEIAAKYEIKGRPADSEGAKALAARDKFEFERWAVSLVDARPNNKQVGDKGIDGVARFATGPKTYGRIIVSVKGGSYTVSHVRDLVGTVKSHDAAMGILVALKPPTKAMREAAAAAGVYEHPQGADYPRVQIVTVAELLDGRMPERPPMLMPYVSGDRLVEDRPSRAQRDAGHVTRTAASG